MKIVGYLCHTLVAVAEHHLGFGYYRLVDPLLCRDTARLANNGAEVSFREAYLVGIEGNMVLLPAMLVDKPEEAVEYVA